MSLYCYLAGPVEFDNDKSHNPLLADANFEQFRYTMGRLVAGAQFCADPGAIISPDPANPR